jgi:actin-related protein
MSNRIVNRLQASKDLVPKSSHNQVDEDAPALITFFADTERSQDLGYYNSSSSYNIDTTHHNSKYSSNTTTGKSAKSKSSAKDLDRSVDVYHETVRQRTVREKLHLLPDLFESSRPARSSTSLSEGPKATSTPIAVSPVIVSERWRSAPGDQKGQMKMAPPMEKKDKLEGGEEEAEETGLPSVRKLLARFEPGRSPTRPESAAVGRSMAGTAPRRSGSITLATADDSRPKWKTMSAENIREQLLNEKQRGREPIQAVEPLVSPPLVYQTGKSPAPSAGASQAQFDPQLFVQSLYNLPTIEESHHVVEDEGPVSLEGGQSSACPSIEGYMEKLPAGRKRPTLWNSWKKHYFVAKGGMLYIYTNKSKTEMIEKLELFGGQVDFMDSNMLGLEDRRGQYIVVRCASHKAAQEWESALSFHTLENYAKTFISPVPIPEDIRSMSSIVVVDLGGASVRAGLCGPQPCLPRLFFPSLMAVNPDNQHDKVFGFDALRPEIRARYTISSPLLPSKKVDKYSVDLVALCGLLLKVFQELRVDPKRTELQLSVPRNFNDKTKVAIAALLFDEFGVKSVNMGHQAVFALYSYSATTGIVVDIGERMDIVPIVAGYRVQSGISRTATGGLELTGHMRHALLGRNYSLTSTLDIFMVRQVVERLCYLARNYDQEMVAHANEEKSVQLAGGSRIPTVTLGPERFHIAEGIFQPELWGLDQQGIHLLVKRALAEVSLDVRKEVAQSIFLSGGLTLIPGFKHRLEAELSKLLSVRPRVHASPYRYHAAFLGACAHAISPAYVSSRISREQWVAGKADVVNAWVL